MQNPQHKVPQDKTPPTKAKMQQTKLNNKTLQTNNKQEINKQKHHLNEAMDQLQIHQVDGEAQTHGEDIPLRLIHVLHHLVVGLVNHLLDHSKEDGDKVMEEALEEEAPLEVGEEVVLLLLVMLGDLLSLLAGEVVLGDRLVVLFRVLIQDGLEVMLDGEMLDLALGLLDLLDGELL